jgi:hypothetical protein
VQLQPQQGFVYYWLGLAIRLYVIITINKIKMYPIETQEDGLFYFLFLVN